MIEIISGTDRKGSSTLKICNLLHQDYKNLGEPSEILDLSEFDFANIIHANYKGAKGDMATAVDRVTAADALVVVAPEYNGSFPGALKFFMDYWKYPDTYESRPVAFVGLGARWGGLRPVEHLQQIFGYRNAYVFPNRVFISNVMTVFKDGKIQDPLVDDLLKIQSKEFIRFIRALKSERLDANSRRKT